MDPHNPASPESPMGGHETDSSSAAQPTTSAIITTPLAALTAMSTPTAGAPAAVSPPSPPTTPTVTMSDLSGPPWPRPPTPRPPLPLPDRVCGLDGADTPPGTPIAGPSFPQHPFPSYPVASSHPGPLAPQPVDDSTSPILFPDIFEPPKDDSGAPRPVLRLRPETGVGEPHSDVESHGVMRSLDEIVNSSGFEIGDPADEDFYADADIGSGSEASSLSSLWASRAYLDRGSGDLDESVRAGPPDHEHHVNNDDNGAGEGNKKGKRKACDCAYCDPDSEPHHDGYFSDSGTATGDEGPRRAGPFVPSFHDSQTAPVKRGSFVFRNGYEGENRDMHERGGDGEDEVIVSVGCELGFPLAPGRSEGWRINDEVARFTPPGPGREIHRLPVPVPVCIRKPPARAVSYRGRRRYRTGSPEFIPDPSIIQLLTPQGTVGAQFKNVADVQVTTEIGLLGGGYGMREIRGNGGCDEVRRGWGGVKGSVVEFKGGDKWELNLKGKEAELNKEAKMGRDSPSGFYDGDDEGTIWAASDAEGAVAQLNAQPANQDFILGPGETRPYILDVIHDDPNKAWSRYTNVADYSINLRGSEKGSSYTVRLRDRRGSLAIMWKRVARVEIVLVGGVVIEINAGDGGASGDDGAEMVGRGVDLRGGGDKDNGNGSSQGEKGLENIGADKGKGRATTGSSTVRSLPSNDESEAEVPQKTRQGKGKGKAVEDGDVTPRNHYHSDSESHGSIPLFFETPADYVQTLGPPHRIENPEPDYFLGSCPCLDRPITDADTNAGPPQCTCIRPASPETLAPEPWTGGYFSPRYQEFLRNGPPNEPYSHSCTAHSESHGEWVSEVRGNLEENIANHASSSKVPDDTAPPNGTSSAPKPLGSPSGDAPKKQRDDAEKEGMKDQGDPAPVSGLEGPPEGDTPEGSRNSSHAYSGQRGNLENEGNSSTNVGEEAARTNIPERSTARENRAERNSPGENTEGGNTTQRGQPQAYADSHAHGFYPLQGPPHLPTFYPPHPPPSPFHFPGQPTITTIQFFPPHEFPSIQYQHPPPAPHLPFPHYNPYIQHPQNSYPHYHPQAAHQPTSTLPEIPESNYFYPDGRPARLRFPIPPDQAAGQQQSGSNHEPAPSTATQNPARITQATASQSAPLDSSSRGHESRPVEEQMVRLMVAFELLRDMHVDLVQRLSSRGL
ncbi:hypothetical protein V501_05133 [Pseudogymnoascus sp. VKM F-4519 (FW-2642)]|nr:hypothetical protein V501_05133 [Pseudogymnoascus sp. VKM F-4519 (FW-2642)]